MSGDLSNYERDDPTFSHDLRESHSTSLLVAQWLQMRGHDVIVYGHHERPSVEQMAEYNDGGADIAILHKMDVKRRPSMHFTCLSDFDKPTIFVTGVHTYDRARVKPWAYINVNAQGTHAAIVMGSTAKFWTKGEVYDKKKKRVRHNYECPKEHLQFVRIGGRP